MSTTGGPLVFLSTFELMLIKIQSRTYGSENTMRDNESKMRGSENWMRDSENWTRDSGSKMRAKKNRI